MNNQAFVMLMGGLGNAIQALPFANFLKSNYSNVTALFYADIDNSMRQNLCVLFKNVFDDFRDFRPVNNLFVSPLHVSVRNAPQNKDLLNLKYWNKSEYLKWFEIHGAPEPPKPVFNTFYENVDLHYEVLLWPGCKKNWRSKQYPHWIDLSKNFDNVAVVGLPQDGPEKFPSHVHDLRGKLSLSQVGGLIKNSKAFIGNEGGVSHYSNSLGADTFVLMGGSDSTKNLVKTNNLFPLSLQLDCQPCQYNPNKKHHATEGCQPLTCLDQLHPRVVAKWVKEPDRRNPFLYNKLPCDTLN